MPTHALSQTGPKRLGDRFLGGKALGQHIDRAATGLHALVLGSRQNPLRKALAKALQAALDPVLTDQIGSYPLYHARAARSINAFISRTAPCNPLNSARAMMLWPIFNSLMPAMAASGSTLW